MPGAHPSGRLRSPGVRPLLPLALLRHEGASGGQDQEGDPGGRYPGAVHPFQGSHAPQSTNELTGACPTRPKWKVSSGPGAQTGRLSKRSSCSHANTWVFVHREQEAGPAADAGCRRLSRIPFCGALKDLSAGKSKRRGHAAPGAVSGGISAPPCKRGRRESLGIWLALPQASAPDLHRYLQLPICTGRCSEGLARCLLLAVGILLSRHKEAFAFQKERRVINK